MLLLVRISAALLLSLIAATAAPAQRGTIHPGVPGNVDPGARYVIYLHGRIIEEQGTRPTDPRFGTYEYHQILDTLAASGLEVVSEQRTAGTDVEDFADHVARQVRQILEAGVPPEHVSVVGFSKGGGIAVLSSTLLGNEHVNFVLLAPCGDWLFRRTDVDVRGRILSIFEASDELGRSCKPLFAHASAPGDYHEIEIHTGQAHGAFYRPHPDWIRPLLAWVGAGS